MGIPQEEKSDRYEVRYYCFFLAECRMTIIARGPQNNCNIRPEEHTDGKKDSLRNDWLASKHSFTCFKLSLPNPVQL